MGGYQQQQSYSGVAGAGLEADAEYLDVITIEEAASLVRPVTTTTPFPLVTLSAVFLYLLHAAADVSICRDGYLSVWREVSD